ncbi:MAG: deoxyribonuclease IV [Coprothermobacterota bacterium]|nr:deoxyribonuclease IV [Coprothermobacterota bacterium]
MIGSNVSTVGGIDKGFIQAKEWGLECIQIYITPSRTWTVPKRDAKSIHNFLQAWQESGGVAVVGHVPFLVNLGSPNPVLFHKSVDRLVCEINSAEELRIRNIIMHPGACGGRPIEQALDQVIVGLNEAISRTKCSSTNILLETMAGQGRTLGATFEQFAYITEHIEDGERIGVCCDTCHLYASGYDIRGRTGFSKVMHEIGNVLGMTKIKAFHLNDSKHPLGSHKDKHCTIGKGFLGIEVFQAIVQSEALSVLPMVIENPDRDCGSYNDVTLLKELRESRDRVKDPEPTERTSLQTELLLDDACRFRRRLPRS